MIFGLVYIVVPLTIFLAVEMVLVGYAVLASALWGIGAAVDGVAGGKANAGKPENHPDGQ
jgi:hypothetical protein